MLPDGIREGQGEQSSLAPGSLGKNSSAARVLLVTGLRDSVFESRSAEFSSGFLFLMLADS